MTRPALLQADWTRFAPAMFVLIWSTGFIVARFGMPHAPPFSFLAWRFLGSVLCFLVWIWLAGAQWPQDRRQWLHLCVVGLLMQVGYLGGVWAAVKGGMSAGMAAVIVGLQPLLTAFWMARSVRDQVPSHRQWWGLLLGLAGVVLVLWRKLVVAEASWLTVIYAVIALLSITAGTLYQKRWVKTTDVRCANTIQMACALLAVLPLAWLETETVRWTPELVGAMAWSVLAISLGANSLLVLLIQRGAATQVTSLMYLVPPCTALLAWLLFAEALTPLIGLGMFFCAMGVALVLRSPVRSS